MHGEKKKKEDAAVHGYGGAHLHPLQVPSWYHQGELHSPVWSEAATGERAFKKTERESWLAGRVWIVWIVVLSSCSSQSFLLYQPLKKSTIPHIHSVSLQGMHYIQAVVMLQNTQLLLITVLQYSCGGWEQAEIAQSSSHAEHTVCARGDIERGSFWRHRRQCLIWMQLIRKVDWFDGTGRAGQQSALVCEGVHVQVGRYLRLPGKL